MKKKLWIPIIIAVVIAVLVIPIPTGIYEDGGTRAYTALTYKLVEWHRITGDTVYDETKVYFFPRNFSSIDALWELEANSVVYKFLATVVELDETYALVQPAEGEDELLSSDRIRIGITKLAAIDATVGSMVEISYTGGIAESYPAQVNAVEWKIAKGQRYEKYSQPWLDKETAEKYENTVLENIVITEIYRDCFIAEYAWPSPYQLKLNGALSDAWCIGDQVTCTIENGYADIEKHLIEADFLTVEESNWQPDPYAAYKPVIYLYPQKEMEVAVSLQLKGQLTCTYPAYNDGWQVTAAPDGTLTDEKGQTYNYLYWEGETNAQWDMTEGFCVKGADAAAFLEEALEKLGLTRREANEFIVYWLPLMERNPYNMISFQTAAYTEAAKLNIEPAPDTLIRVFMTWKRCEDQITLPEQVLTPPERKGFTVVEWGGTEIK